MLGGCVDSSTGDDGGSAGLGTGGTVSSGGRGAAGSNGVAGATAGAGGTSVAGSGGNTGGAGQPANGGSMSGSSASGGSTSGGAGAGATGGSAGGAGGSAGTDALGGAPSAGRGGAGGAGMGGAPSGGAGAGGRGGATGGGAGSGGMGGAPSTCPAQTPPTGGNKYCSNNKGNVGKYGYELWSSGVGQGCMTVYNKDATFSATWTGVDDFLARIGLDFDKTKTPSQVGTISADFVETKTGNTGLVYVGIYGWTDGPLREYYILDDWGTMKPSDTASDGTPRTHVGQIMVDDAMYDVWKHTQVNKPAITGDNKTFDQYFSVRSSARQCGHISISTHFSEWAKLGLDLGKLYEAKILVESQDSTGTIDFTSATVSVK